jgi:hypothetical protein
MGKRKRSSESSEKTASLGLQLQKLERELNIKVEALSIYRRPLNCFYYE